MLYDSHHTLTFVNINYNEKPFTATITLAKFLLWNHYCAVDNALDSIWQVWKFLRFINTTVFAKICVHVDYNDRSFGCCIETIECKCKKRNLVHSHIPKSVCYKKFHSENIELHSWSSQRLKNQVFVFSSAHNRQMCVWLVHRARFSLHSQIKIPDRSLLCPINTVCVSQ